MASTASILLKYDQPGPRYTSYPTVPLWTSDVDQILYKRNLEAIDSQDLLSLYFHMPFCENRCHFCGCSRKNTQDKGESARYTRRILQEIQFVASHLAKSERCVSQIHFGGGSPNFFKPDEISAIMAKARQLFKILPHAEIALEMNPKTTKMPFCQNLAIEGFNRISIGVQDFDPHVQKLINRNQSFETTRDMVLLLRSLGLNHINMDFVYGLPGQNPETFTNTLKKVISLGPDRLAVYSYAHVPWAHPEQRAFKENDIPDPKTKVALFELAFDHLTSNGYHLIGLDHFARDGDELLEALKNHTIHRNFMGYSTRANAHQIGFGATAISYVNKNYFQNDKDIDAYQQTIDQGHLTTVRGCLTNNNDRIRRELINEIMCHRDVDLDAFEKQNAILFKDHFAIGLKKLAPLVLDGLVVSTPHRLTVTEQGQLVLRNIAMCFDAYLDKIPNQGFSRTV